MQISYSTKLPLTVSFSQNSLSKKSGSVALQLTITAYPASGAVIPQGNIDNVVWQVVQVFDKTTFLSIDDPYLPSYLDPKNGHTKQEFIKTLRTHLEESESPLVIVGRETPPNTFDRRVLLVSAFPTVTVESVGTQLLTHLKDAWAKSGLTSASLKLEMHNAENNTAITLSDYTPTSQLTLSI